MSETLSSALPLAAQLRQQRLRLGLTQAAIAGRSRLSVASYKRFERSGRISLERLFDVAAALGMSLTLAGTGTTSAAVDPRVVQVRQRGLRRVRPVSPPRPESDAPTASLASPQSPQVAAPATPKPTVDSAAVADMMKRYGDPIRLLIRAMVFNGLGNYTARNVVQNVMRSNRVSDADQPAFVAAVAAQIAQLNSENCVALGINATTYEPWAKTWNPELGIVGALE
jgi:transcriptional regulator with XRE-family HTH domain